MKRALGIFILASLFILFFSIPSFAEEFTVRDGTEIKLTKDTVAGSVYKIEAGATVTFIGDGSTSKARIEAGENVTLTLKNVNIDVSDTDEACALHFTGKDNKLILKGKNSLKSGENQPGIKVEDETVLTISGEGTVTATGGFLGAGIGGGQFGSGGPVNNTGGTITITGGTVTATGGDYGAGIGGGEFGSGRNITIEGGTVTATGGDYGAGIGGGYKGSGGTITIAGDALVFASGDKNNKAKDIGKGTSGSDEGSLTIEGIAKVFYKHNSYTTDVSTAYHSWEKITVSDGSAYNESLPDSWEDGTEIGAHILQLAIKGDDVYGSTLTATVEDTTESGRIKYEWTMNREDGTLGTKSTYVVTESGIAGHIITLTVSSSDKQNGINGTLSATTDAIAAKTLTTTNAAITIPNQTYTGSPIEPRVTVKDLDLDKELTLGTDYTVSYSNNTNPGTASATITGIGNYKGEVTINFSIIRKRDRSSSSSSTSSSSSVAGAKTITYTQKGKDEIFNIEDEGVTIEFNGLDFKNYKNKIVQIKVEEIDKEDLKISEELAEKIGDLPIFDISIYIDGKKTNFEFDNPITIEIPFETDLDSHKFVAVYINDENGDIEIMDGVLIDGVMKFTTKHLSNYAILYAETDFEDISNCWGKEAIEALAARKIVLGKEEGKFDPKSTMTRAEYVTIIVRYFGLTSDSSNNYADVEEDKWYTENIAIAKDNGILPEIYNDTFGPNKEITRQEMMYILYKSLEITDRLANYSDNGDKLSDYADYYMVEDYAVEGSEYLISRDIINGDGEGNLNPTDTSTREEVVQMLWNMMKLEIKN